MQKRLRKTTFLSCLILLLSLPSTVFTQSGNHRALSKNELSQYVSSQKTATVPDQPEYCLNFDSQGTGWDTVSQVFYTYSPSGNIPYEYTEYKSSSGWVPSSDFRRTFDTDGNVTEVLQRSHNGASWDTLFLYELAYSPQGDFTEQTAYLYQAGVWDTIYSFHFQYQYDSQNRAFEIIEQRWSSVARDYSNHSRMTYVFDNGPAYNTFTWYAWNGQQWTATEREMEITWHDAEKDLRTGFKN